MLLWYLVDAVDMLHTNDVTLQPSVLHANAMQPENVVPQAPVQLGSTGTEPNIAQNLAIEKEKLAFAREQMLRPQFHLHQSLSTMSQKDIMFWQMHRTACHISFLSNHKWCQPSQYPL